MRMSKINFKGGSKRGGKTSDGGFVMGLKGTVRKQCQQFLFSYPVTSIVKVNKIFFRFVPKLLLYTLRGI